MPSVGTDERERRVRERDLRTDLLLGVDFVPARDQSIAGGTPAPPQSRATATVGTTRAAHGVQSPMAIASASPGSKGALLEALRLRHEQECPHCTVVTGHMRLVFGEGNPEAALMFIGEAPGEEEDRTGRPFVGRAGQKLDEIIAAMTLRRQDVYIANVLKARPPGNRTPVPDEVAKCGPYLVDQIRIIQPRVIVTLGGPATKMLLSTDEGITRLRGSWAAFRDESSEIPVMPTFHPAYLLRNYTPDTRAKIWSDMQAVMTRLGLTR